VADYARKCGVVGTAVPTCRPAADSRTCRMARWPH